MRKFLTFLTLLFSMHAQASTHKAKHGSNDQNPATSAPPITEQTSKSQPPPYIGQQQAPYVVRIVVPGSKDGWDKAAMIINLSLALTGVAAVIAAICTLRAINRQAREATLQRITTRDTLRAIKLQVDLMKEQNDAARNRERARLSIINLSIPEFTPNVNHGPNAIQIAINISIVNDGYSNAFNVVLRYFVRTEVASELLTIGPHEGYAASIPKVFRGFGREHTAVYQLAQGFGQFPIVLGKYLEECSFNRQIMRVYGFLEFEDISGQKYVLPYDYLWSVSNPTGIDKEAYKFGNWINRITMEVEDKTQEYIDRYQNSHQ